MICKPRDPEAKGLVERANDYLETLVPARPHVHRPGRLQRPAGRRGCDWRTRGGAGRWAARRPTGSARTGRRCWRCRRSPPATGWRLSARLPRDHYVRLDSNDYSVHPSVIGRRVEVDRRPGPGAGVLRGRSSSPTTTGSGPGTRRSPTPSTSPRPPRCAATRIAPAAARSPSPRCEQRGLTDYDTALGLGDVDGAVA